MKKHHMKLATESFNKTSSTEKVIELRLYDEKRRNINIGDTIEFSESDNSQFREHCKNNRKGFVAVLYIQGAIRRP